MTVTTTTNVMNDADKKETMTVFAVMLMYFLVPTQGVVLAAFQTISEAFPDVGFTAISYLATIVALAQIPAALFSGAVAGRKVRYRTICIWSLALYVAAGVVPYFATNDTNFNMILFSRFLFGLGLGAFSPLTNALVTTIYRKNEQKRASMLGYGNTIFNIAAIAAQTGGGFLCLISWQTTFLFYLVGIIPLIAVVLFLKEPEATAEESKERVKIPMVAYLYLMIFTITLIATYPVLMFVSMIMAQHNLGGAGLAGTLLSVFTVVGAVIAALFGNIYKVLKNKILPIAILINALAMFVVYYSSAISNLPLFVSAFVLVGFGLTGITIGTPMILSTTVSASVYAAAMGLNAAFMNAGAFLSSPYTSLIVQVSGNEDPRFVLLVSGIIMVIFSAIMMVIVSRIKQTADPAMGH